MSSHTAGRKSMARKALYFARRSTDRSLRTPTIVSVWNALNSHRSSLHASSADGAVISQLQFYADVVDLVASSATTPRSAADSPSRCTELLQLVTVYRSLVDCVGYLGAERAACTAFLPARQQPQAVCDHVSNREMFVYAHAAFASDVCFRSLGRQATAAAKSKVLAAMQLYGNDDDGLATCRRRLLPDLGSVKSAVQTASTVDVWKCGRARRLRQLRRLQLSLNKSISDEADSMLDQLERDVVARWMDERHAASWRLAVSAAGLSTSLVYLLIGCVCQCRAAAFHGGCRCNGMTLRPSACVNAPANNETDADDNDVNDLERPSLRLACLLTKSTSV